jgi:hypothetical protein
VARVLGPRRGIPVQANTCSGRSKFVERGKEASRVEIALALGGCDVDGHLRIVQRVLETILLFIDGRAGFE